MLLKSGRSQEWAGSALVIPWLTSHPIPCAHLLVCVWNQMGQEKKKKKGKKKVEVCFLSTFPLFYTAARPASIVFSQLEKI